MDTSMNLILLAHELLDYSPQLHIRQKDRIGFQGVRLLSPGSPSGGPFLYLARASALPSDLSGTFLSNLLCIEDSPLPPAYADSRQINLLLLKKDIPPETLINQIQNLWKKSFPSVSSALLHVLAKGKGLQSLIDAGSELLGNPVILLDINRHILAYSKGFPTGSPYFGYLTGDRYAPPFSAYTAKMEKLMERVYESPVPLPAHEELSGCPILIGKILIDQKAAGHLEVVFKQKPGEKELRAVSVLCDAVSLEMQKTKSLDYSKTAIFEHLILDFLNGTIENPNSLDARKKILQLALQGNLYVLTVTGHKPGNSGLYLSYLKNLLEHVVSIGRSVIYENRIVFLLNPAGNPSRLEDSLAGFKNFLTKKELYAGLSCPFQDIRTMRKYYDQSVKALDLGRRLHKERVLFRYENYASYHLIELHSSQTECKDYCHPGIFQLMAYDEKNGTSFTASLYCYLEKSRNISESAKALNIHRNTMKYHVEKIQKIMDADLNDNLLFFRIYHGMIMLRFMNT